VALDHSSDWENGPNWQTDLQTLVTNLVKPFFSLILTFFFIPTNENDFGSLDKMFLNE